jgi:hypothetical protein
MRRGFARANLHRHPHWLFPASRYSLARTLEKSNSASKIPLKGGIFI